MSMFRKESAKRMVTSLLENTGFVCGSIKDTLSEKDVDINWIKSSTRSMAGSLASRACTKDLQASPEAVEGRIPFFEEESVASGEETDGNDSSRRSRFSKIKKKRDEDAIDSTPVGANTLVIGLCLSRRDATLGHPDTVTRQTAFDFNELQDREYSFVSSTDPSGWLAGGGEKGQKKHSRTNSDGSKKTSSQKIPAPDKVHIPIIQINAESSAVADEIISALARGEVFIPHMAILPEALSVNGLSPPDLVVRFDCEKNDDANPEDWPNWCLEFLHNQLYDLFEPYGAQWTKRPFQITLAKKVKWKTVKHMNKFFANAEQVVNTWREKGPQYLHPPESPYMGATHDEVARPHGIYLLRNGVPTNYFAPNFNPPYTTKVTRSLIRNVINKSWDVKRRDWLVEPPPRVVGPAKFINTMFACVNTENHHISPVESHAMFDLHGDSLEEHTIRRIKVPKSPGRRHRKEKENKETIENNAELIKAESPRTPKNSAVTHPVPSDESFGPSKPCETLSMEETMTESITDAHTQPSAESTAASSTQYSKSTLASSRQSEEMVENDLFEPRRMVALHKPVEEERVGELREEEPEIDEEKEDRYFEPKVKMDKSVSFDDDQYFEPKVNTVKSVSYEDDQYFDNQKENNIRAGDTKAEKFAKTKSKRREMRDRRQDENTPISTKLSPRTPKPSSPTESATMSLAYSLEDSTFFKGVSSTPTHTLNDGGSVLTMATENQSLLSYVTRSTMVQSKIEASIPDDDDISLSLLESNSSIVPSDEELLAIGWAKALDSNSGLYYYFTLDRSKTVWENPLNS